MPREPRELEVGIPYHLISRFVDREWFITKPNEREFYLRLLAHALDESDWKLLAFAVMSNHIHLAIVTGRQPLDHWIRRVHAPFADAMNRAYQRIGPMFVRGPKAYPVELGRVGHLIAYIHNNPVRAGVCSSAVSTDWTSHRAYVGAADVPPWLHVDEGLRLCNISSGTTFDEWVNDPDRTADELFSEADHELEIMRRLEQQAAEQRAREEQEPRINLANRIAHAAAATVGISPAQLRGSSRGEVEVLARSAAIHCAKRRGLSEQSIAHALCISQQRVSVVRRREPSEVVRALAVRIDEYVQAQADGSERK